MTIWLQELSIAKARLRAVSSNCASFWTVTSVIPPIRRSTLPSASVKTSALSFTRATDPSLRANRYSLCQ